MKKRDLTIDIAKGICIFLVVLGHCHNAGFIRHYIYLFHMPLFFFLSGMFFHPEEKLAYGILFAIFYKTKCFNFGFLSSRIVSAWFSVRHLFMSKGL